MTNAKSPKGKVLRRPRATGNAKTSPPEPVIHPKVLSDFAVRLSQVATFGEMLDSIAESVLQLDICERVFILTWTDGQFGVARQRTSDRGTVPTIEELGFSRTLAELSIKAGQRREWTGLDQIPIEGRTRSITEHELKSAICVPLMVNADPIGVLYLDSRRIGLIPTTADLESLDTLAQIAAVALDSRQARDRAESETRRLSTENSRLRSEITSEWNTELIGSDPSFMPTVEQAHRVATLGDPILFVGETGTGKDLLASIVHRTDTTRSDNAMMKVNCSTLSPELLERQLFGASASANPTGVESPGVIEQADGGTLYLDEISDLPLAIQNRLVEFLDSQKFTQVGDTVERSSSVRVVASTRKDPSKLVKGGLVPELFYRLGTVTVEIPPLRERRTDIVLLTEFFLEAESKRQGKRLGSPTPRAVKILLEHPWPGNVRELKNTISAASVMIGDGDPFDLIHLAPILKIDTSEVSFDERDREPETLQEATRKAAREVLVAAMRRHGKVSAVADELGITKQHVYNLLREHGLEKPSTSA